MFQTLDASFVCSIRITGCPRESLSRISLRPEARFSKVPKLFGRISDDAKASRGTKLYIYFNFPSLYNICKDQPYRISGSEIYEWFFGTFDKRAAGYHLFEIVRKRELDFLDTSFFFFFFFTIVAKF